MKQYRPANPVIRVRINAKGQYQVEQVEDGGRGPQHTDLGPGWPTGKEAYDYARLMESRVYVSPLRDESSTGADRGSPFPVSASAEAAADPAT